MPIKSIDLVSDAKKYKEEMAKELKRETPAPQKFIFIKGYKGPKDGQPRNILLLGPLDATVVSDVKGAKGARVDSQGSFTTNADKKLVFDPPDRAKSISKTLSVLGYQNRVQLRPGETEDDEDGASAPTATPSATPPTPAPQAAKPAAVTPTPTPPQAATPTPAPTGWQAAKPTGTSTPPTPPPQSAKPQSSTPTPTASPTATPTPAPTGWQAAKPASTTPTPTATPTSSRTPAPTGWQAAKPTATPPTPTAPQATPTPHAPTGPTATGWKPGVTPPAPKPTGATPSSPAWTPGAKPPAPTPPPQSAKPATSAPTTGTKPPVTPPSGTTPPLDDKIREQCANKLEEVKRAVAAAVALPAVPPVTKADIEGRVKAAEAMVTARRYTDALEQLEKLEKDAHAAAHLPAAQPAQSGADPAADCKKAADEAKTALDGIAGNPAVNPATKTKLAEAYKAAVELRDKQQFQKATDEFKNTLEAARAAVSGKATAPTKEEEQANKLSSKEKAHAQAVADRLVESQIQTDILVGDLNSPALEAIMAEHRAYVPREMKAFTGYRVLDDVARLRSESKRGQVLKDMNAAFTAAADRQARFYAELKKVKDQNSPEVKEGAKLAATMLGHIPDSWLAERSTLGKRLATLVKDPNEKAAELQEALKVKQPDAELQAELDEEHEAVMAAVEHGSLKSGDRVQFYFDAPVKSITGEQQKKMQEAYNKSIDRAYKIRDLGGSPADAEAAMAHIPPDFWPPAFIEAMQAWRKVERELADERVAAMFKAKPGFKVTKATVLQGANAVLSLCSEAGSVQNLPGELGTVTSDIGGVAETIQGIAEVGADVGKGVGKLANVLKEKPVADSLAAFMDVSESLSDGLKKKIDEEDFESMTEEQLEQSKTWLDRMAQAGKVVETAINAVSNLQNVPIVEATQFAAQVCPILNIVANGIDIGLAAKQLGVEIQRRVQTGRLKGKAELRYFGGEDWDGGALVDACRNEIKQRNRNVTKQSVDIAGKGVALAGNITTVAAAASPGGQAAGVALQVVGKGIQVGNKLVFTGIDWGVASNAKKLMAEARAGNPVARQQIFADSGLYAKMYIAVLAKENHPLAQQFLVQRGYQEKDIMKASVSLKIMREALLKDAGQKDETTVSDSFVGQYIDTYAGGPKKVVVGGAKAAASGAKTVTKKVTDKVKGREAAYDAGWRATETIALDEATWDKVKQDAVAAGLRDEATGIGAALKTVAETAAKQASAPPDKKAELAFALIEAYEKAAEVVGKAHPLTNDEAADHAGMVTFLASERSGLLTIANGLRNALKVGGTVDVNWKPVAGGPGSSASWKANWDSAVKRCHLPPGDAGVTKAWETFEAAYAKVAGEPNAMKKRELQIKARDLIAPVTAGLGECWMETAEFPGLRTYVDGQQDELMKLSRTIDATLFGGDWKGPAVPKEPALAAAEFNGVYDYAKKEGYIDAPNTVAAKLQAVEDGAKALAKMAPSPSKRKARENQTKAIAEAVKTIEALTAKAAETHPTFKAYLLALRKSGHAAVAKVNEESRDEDFGTFVSRVPGAFERTFDLAVAAGAIENETKYKKSFSEALTNLESALKKIGEAKGPAAKYKAFGDLSKEIEKAAAVIEKVQAMPGGDNKIFAAYMVAEAKLIADLDKDPIVEPILDGSALDDLKSAPAFTWKDADWQKVKKEGVAGGLFPDAKTGTGDSITAGEKAYQDFKKAEKDAKKNRQACEAAVTQLKATQKVFTTQLDRAKTINKANLAKYFDNARESAKSRLEELETWTKANPAPKKP